MVPGGDETWYIIDYDTLRWISVISPHNFSPEDHLNSVEALRPLIDHLSPMVTGIIVDDQGRLMGTSTSIDDDQTPFVRYPRFTRAEVGRERSDILLRSQLQEVDRLHRCVDLVRPLDSFQLLVFKHIIRKENLEMLWDDAFLSKRLSGHPNLISFHRFILDDVEPRLLGFTTIFVPGGTLRENVRKRPFQKKWLLQLLDVVDHINLQHGIIHQDINPRNLLINTSDDLILFDFNRAVQVGSKFHIAEFNDVAGVIHTLYESLTDDCPRPRNSDKVERLRKIRSMRTWEVKAAIEPGTDVKELRDIVEKWAERRRMQKAPETVSEIPKPLKWPDMPPENIREPYIRSYVPEGERIIRWERLPYSKQYKKDVPAE